MLARMKSFQDRKLRAATDVLVQELPDGESVFLDLKSERYFGLDPAGTRFWKALTGTGSSERAYRLLLDEYDVTPERLRDDLEHWIQKLLDQGLLELAS